VRVTARAGQLAFEKLGAVAEVAAPKRKKA